VTFPAPTNPGEVVLLEILTELQQIRTLLTPQAGEPDGHVELSEPARLSPPRKPAPSARPPIKDTR
jgi:hypothetical protein